MTAVLFLSQVVSEVGMRFVDDRVSTHFQMQVKSCGLVIAIMTESFQHSAQCRTEIMLAKQMNKIIILLQVLRQNLLFES